MVSVVLNHLSGFIDFAHFLVAILAIYYAILFFSHRDENNPSRNNNSYNVEKKPTGNPLVNNKVSDKGSDEDKVSPLKSSHPNLTHNKISKRESNKSERRKFLLSATKGFIINSEQAAEKLINDILSVRSEVDLVLAKDLIKEIYSNLRNARYELRKERRKERGEKRKYVSNLQAYVENLLFNIANKLNHSLPNLDDSDYNWDKKIKRSKSLTNNIKVGSGYLIKSIDKFIEDSEHNLSNLSITQNQVNEQELVEDQNRISNINRPLKINQDLNKYYANAPSTRIFYNFPSSGDETGMLNIKEENDRLFKRKPIFSNKIFYSMNDNIISLYKNYTSSVEPLMSNFNQYLAEIETIVNCLEKFPKKCSGALVIPTYQEGKSIYTTLEKYASCSNSEEVAIFILENHPSKTSRDETYSEIERFRNNHQKIHVYHIYKIFKERVPIGLIRKYLTEIVLMLKAKSGHSGNLILIGGDADCVGIDKRFFSSILSSFKRYNKLDAIEMKLNFPLSYRLAFPNMWIMHRFFDFCWSYKRNKLTPNKAIRMYGPASAIKASSYLMIKGFNPRARLCEDLELSYMLDSGRRAAVYDKNNPFFKYSSNSITTNPRRALSSYLSGMNLLTMYDGFEEKDEIRSLSWTELVKKEGRGLIRVGNLWSHEEIRDYINEGIHLSGRENHKDSGSYLSVFMQQSIDWWQYKIEFGKWMSTKQFEKMLKRVMTFLGIEYILDTSDKKWVISILNVENCVNMMNVQLQRYHKENTFLDINKISIEKGTYKSKKK